MVNIQTRNRAPLQETMMTVSMTGFAAANGQGAGYAWVWDLRSVNGKGLDLRLRLPDWIDGLEAAVRADLGRAVQRGNVSLSLKLARNGAEGGEGLAVNAAVLRDVLRALSAIEETAMANGVTLGQPTSADVLAFRGVLETASADPDTAPLRRAILADLPALIADFQAMRAGEGAALAAVIGAQLTQIDTLTRTAADQAAARRDNVADQMRDAVAKVLAQTDAIDEARLAQELALIGVKTDVTEELDRLIAHVDAARSLLAGPGQIGRKFDFLMQEFMREANTLCAKSQSLALTRTGLDLKTVIDQMREQVQNVE